MQKLKDYKIYFTTPLYPDSEDAEGWVSQGYDSDDAFKRLYEFFKREGDRGVALMTFYKVQIEEAETGVPAFYQIQ